MATRHELIHIDFVANAGKANPVLKSLQDSCEQARVAKEKLDRELNEAKTQGAPVKVIAEIEERAQKQTKTWQALQRGVREYTKGIDTLSKGIKEFNQGTLDEMSAKFNKALYNAAKLAQSSVKTGSQEWNQLQRLMDAADRNVTRAKEDIDALFQTFKDGGSVSAVQLTRAKDALEDLARLAVTNSEEWRHLTDQAREVGKAVTVVAETEKRLRGEITSEQDAMALSNNLTREAIDLRRQQGEAALDTARKERQAIEATMKGLQEAIAERSGKLASLEYTISEQEDIPKMKARRDAEIEKLSADRKDAEQRMKDSDRIIKEYNEQRVEVAELKRQKEELEKQERKNAKATEDSSAALEKNQQELSKTQGDVKILDGSIEELNRRIEKMQQQPVKPKVDTSEVEQAKKKEAEASKQQAEANREEAKSEEATVKAEEQHKWTIDELTASLQASRKELDALIAERAELLKQQEKSVATTKEETNAFRELTKEQAQAMLDQRKATITKEADGKMAYTNIEDAQHFLIESMRQAGSVSGGAASLDSAGVQKVRAMFRERYGLESDDDALAAIRGLMSGGFIKGGMMNNAFSRIDFDTSKVAAYSKEIKDLTAVIKGEAEAVEKETKAEEKNAETKRTLEQVEQELEAKEKDHVERAKLLMRMRNGENVAIDEQTQKQKGLTEAKKETAAAYAQELEAIKKMTAEQAKAAKDAMLAPSTVGYKAGKLDMSNLEEVQSFLITQMRKMGTMGRDGSLSIAGGQIDNLLTAFQNKYGFKGEKKTAKDIIREIVKGGGGLLNGGGIADFSADTMMVKVNTEAYAARTEKLKALIAITNGVQQATDKTTESTRKSTEATREGTKATEESIKAQEEEVAHRKKAYEAANEEFESRKQKLKDMKSALARMPKSGPDALLARSQAQDDIDDYNENQVKTARANTAKLKKLYEGSMQTLAQMMGAEKEATEAKKRRTKATKDQTEADQQSVATEETIEQLMARKAQLESEREKKQKRLTELQNKINEANKQGTETTTTLADATEKLAQAETDLETKKEAADKAKTTKRRADRAMKNADEEITRIQGEEVPTRKTEAEMGALKKQAADTREELARLQSQFDENAKKIAAYNKAETDAAIEMAQAENVSIERVKQSIELLQKKIQTEATDEETMHRRGEAINRLKDRLTEMNAEVARLSKPIADKLDRDDLGTLTEPEIKQAMEATRQLISTYKAGSAEVDELNKRLVRADQFLKEHGEEAARQALKTELMETRMQNLTNLSDAALQKTRKFWQAMYDGAEKNDPELKNIEQRLKNINDEEQRRSRAGLEQSAARLSGNLGNLSSGELRQAIEDGKKLQSTYRETSREARELANQILNAEEYAKSHGIEAMRAARKEQEALRQQQEQERELNVTMTQRLYSLKTLSADATAEAKKYWTAQKNGAEEGTAAFRKAELALSLIDKAEERRTRERQEQLVKRLEKPDEFSNYTTAELRESIEAAKQLALSYKSGSDEATKLTQRMVDAEEYINKYSAETERATRRQTEAIKQMQDQLAQGTALTESALKAQINYWQRLIDDPKNANENLQPYIDNLTRAKDLLKEVQTGSVSREGANTLTTSQSGGFADASMEKLDDAIKKLKEYQQVINDPKGTGKDTFEAVHTEIARLTAQLDALKGKAETAKGSVTAMFLSTDEVMNRFADHTGKSVEVLESGVALTGMDEQEQRIVEARRDEELRKIEQAQERVNDLNEAIRDKEEEIRRLDAEVTQAEAEMNANMGAIIQKPEKSSTELKQEADEFLENVRIQEEVVENFDREILEYDKKVAKLQQKIDRINEKQQKRRGLLGKLLTPFAGEEDGGNPEEAARMANAIGEQTPWARDEARKKQEYQTELELIKKLADEKRKEREDEKNGLREVRAIYEEKREAYVAAQHAEEKLERAETARQTHQEKMQELLNTQNEKAALEGVRNGEEAALQRLTEAEQNRAQQSRENHRMTKEELAEGIKMLEAEALAQDRTTEEGQKRWTELRNVIEQMNKELKEATGEWMTLAQAEQVASQAGTDNFFASPDEIQKATQAITRQREALIKTIQAKKAGNQATDDEEKKLDELTRHLRNLKFEQDNFNISQEKMHMLMKQPAQAVNLDELRAAIKRADAQLRRMEGSLGANSDEYKKFAKEVREAKLRLKEMEDQSKATTSAFEKAWQRLKTYVTFYVSAAAAIQKITATFGDLMDLSDRMGEVRKTTGFTADEVGRLSDNLAKMDTRTPLVELLSLSAAAGQLGLKTQEDVQGFTEAANKLMVALPEMGREAATEMLKVALATGEIDKIQRQMQQGLVEGSSATAVAMEKIGSTIDQLRANSAAAAPQITDFVKRVGAVGAQSGISIDQVAALGATVDALGMRTEMSATALSRMIPAIKNNAYAIGQIIGKTEGEIREKFRDGMGMEVILEIFDAIRNNSEATTGDLAKDAKAIENMFGGTMQDTMKELNQQGARAGIVFAGLSQNVDQLRQMLGVAHSAYEENIAIMSEYNKMNDTTAAKWARFKNELEEFFVGDNSQWLLGGLIDGVRGLLNLLTGSNGVSATLRTIILALSIAKLNIAGIITGTKGWSLSLKGVATWLGIINKETGKLQWGNIFTAIGAAILYVVYQLSQMKSAYDRANEALGKTRVEIDEAHARFEGYWKTLKDTSVALDEARRSHEKLSAEVDRLRKTTDGSAASTENLKKKEDELKQSEDNVTKASNDHKTAIANMNSIYGKYLGFILTEANYSNLAAAAHDKVTAAIEREMLAKQRQAAIANVDSKYTEDMGTNYGKMSARLTESGGLSRSDAAKAMTDLQRFMRENVRYDAATDKTVVSEAITDAMRKSGLDLRKADANEIVALWYDQYLKDNFHLSDHVRSGLTGVQRRSDLAEGWGVVRTPFVSNLRANYADTYVQRERERGAVSALYDESITHAEGEEAKSAQLLLTNLEKEAQAAKKRILDKNTADKDRNQAYQDLANALEGLDNRIKELNPKEDAETIKRLQDMAKNLNGDGINVKKLKEARRQIHATLFDRATFDENAISNINETNPYGSYDQTTSPYKEWNSDDLVARRKDMLERVRALANGADVQKVLSEDSRFINDAVRKNIKTMDQAIEWYNTERLKIQDVLHSRHLTNTGDWDNPKAQKNRKKLISDEMRAYLEELDAYYTERKTQIEQARQDEELTEAEAWQRNIDNETEWHHRRAELQQLYGKRRKEVAEDEAQAIFRIISERTGEDVKFIEKSIGKTVDFIKAIGTKSEAEMRRIYADIDLGTEKDNLKSQQELTKQLKFIEDTIRKERPYDGLTANLQDNLTKMGLLLTDFDKRRRERQGTVGDLVLIDTDEQEERFKRMHFLLEQAEGAYRLTWEQLEKLAREKGFDSWMTAITGDENADQMKQALLGQLRTLYDGVQDAIKKESSIIKKHTENLWNDALIPSGDQMLSLKDAYEQAISRTGLEGDRVSRANSLIGAGNASARVADRLAIKQLQLQLDMQQHYYNLMRQQGELRISQLQSESALEAAKNKRILERVALLRREAEVLKAQGKAEEANAKTAEAEKASVEAAEAAHRSQLAALDAQHAQTSLNLAKTKELVEEEKLRVQIANQVEESQNRLYQDLREWADLLTSSLQQVMEAEHAGDAEYYNERAKLNLTGKGGPGAGTYVVIDNAGTSDAQAHYEYLDERQALERQHEIEIENARAEAWKKVWDDLNMKMSDQITDWVNAAMQNAAVDANTEAVNLDTEATKLNTQALQGLTSQLAQGIKIDAGGEVNETIDYYTNDPEAMPRAMRKRMGLSVDENPYDNTGGVTDGNMSLFLSGQEGGFTYPWEQMAEAAEASAERQVQAIDKVKVALDSQFHKQQQGSQDANKKMQTSTQSAFAKMTLAANMYGTAYQVMQNDNLSASQKFQLFAVQAAGNAAIAMLTTNMATTEGDVATQLPGILGKAASQLGPIAGPIAFAAMSALLGGLMGLAVSKITKSKQTIAQATGASASAGRLSTGMLTYAEGNVNEFSDPASLTPGRTYNVDAADGRTYRAKYTGANPSTHITNGAEFHLVGERGREAIIDAHTTRLLQMDDTGIWQSIQTLYNGGSLAALRRSHSARRGRGMAAFADGNLDDFAGEDFTELADGTDIGGGMDLEMVAAMQSSLERNNELLERALTEGLKAVNVWHGPEGIPNMVNKYNKEAQRHGVKYL